MDFPLQSMNFGVTRMAKGNLRMVKPSRSLGVALEAVARVPHDWQICAFFHLHRNAAWRFTLASWGSNGWGNNMKS